MPSNRVDIWSTERAVEWVGSTTSSPPPPPYPINQTARGTQELLTSFGHPYQKLGRDTGDIGGPFSVVRREYKHASPYMRNRTVNGENASAYNYLGRYFASQDRVTDADFEAPILPTNSELDALGTTAIARIAPTNPISGLAVTLGELRSEGIPSLVGANTWRSRTLSAKNAGGEYLNHQFGWVPLLSEIRGFANTVANSHEIAAKYERESGKLLHRRFTFPVSISTTSSEATGTYPDPQIKVGYWSGSGKTTTVITTREETWFSGAFTYHLPPIVNGDRRARDLAIANKLYGVRVTPEVVWNLTPWSWAVDWFSNMGDVITNMTLFSSDGLVMPYGYIMRKRTVTKLVTHSGSIAKYGQKKIDCWQEFTTTVKSRRKATPFGFGLDVTAFTPWQWSILAALGLSRGSSGMKYG